MTDSWQYTPLPNIPILQCKLGEDVQKFLWGLIDESSGVSHYLNDTDNYFFKNHLKEQCEKYIEDNRNAVTFRNSFTHAATSQLVLRDFWCTICKENEPIPYHDHTGVLSFAIWLRMPGNSKFSLSYTDILGQIRRIEFNTNDELVGNMIVFPATLGHQVYPFSETDGTRVSVSGNLYLDTSVIINS
tara:strand:- start:71 stop:631 length:561 start_codon:yes stop_codon:yes gene_type:complete